VPVSQLQNYAKIQSELAEIQTARQRDREEAERRNAERMMREGELEKGMEKMKNSHVEQLAAKDKAFKEMEFRAQRWALQSELARALSSQELVTGGADQLAKLWAHEFQVDNSGDGYSVRTADFKSVIEYVAENLKRPEYQHFVKAKNPAGGTGHESSPSYAAPTTPAAPAPVAAPKTLGEAILLDAQNKATAMQSQGNQYGSQLGKPFGLTTPRRVG
jgi:hypothetical protein